MNINNFGTLYVVATPIGNLQDMGQRAIETLKKVDYIAAEDTRHSQPLLQYFLVSTPMIALHEHNERERAQVILAKLKEGKSIALISDAGTPLINDPGYFLVREARALGIRVSPVPGSCALTAALCVSGLPTDRFTYEGFLPAKAKSRIAQLERLRYEMRTMVFYEAPHRVLECLQDMATVFGGCRQAAMARELTKMYETIFSSTLEELIRFVANDENQRRGEIVIMLAGSTQEPEISQGKSAEEILKVLLNELPLKQAVELAAKLTDQRKNALYQQALQIKPTQNR